MADDLLDYTATAQELGKNPGADMREGKLTLPLIHSLANADEQDTNWMQGIIRDPVFDLRRFEDLKEKFNVKSGLSDHTLGIVTPVAAVVLGATVIEKHFILNKEVGGPDASFSLDEKEFTEMVTAIRNAEKAVGNVNYNLSENAQKSREFCRSIYISDDVKNGDIITEKNIQTVRPGFGLHPKHFDSVLGKKFNSDFDKGTPLKLDFID